MHTLGWASCPLRTIPLLVLPLMTACGAGSGSASNGNELTGEATFAVETVPSSVQCIQITVNGSTTVTQQFGVTAGASSVALNLGQLPTGFVVVNGQAFNAACSGIAGAQPTWVADPLYTTLDAGQVTTLTLNFRQELPTGASANFIGSATQIAVEGSGTCVLMADSSIEGTGNVPFNDGVLNPTDPNLATYYTLVPGPLPKAKAIAGDNLHLCEIRMDSSFGCSTSHDNMSGSEPALPSGDNPVQIATGAHHACVLGSLGDVDCWGDDYYGELGNGSSVAPSSGYATVYIGATHIATGGYTTCAVTNGGSVECWGNNNYGQVGDGTTTNRLAPTTVAGMSAATQVTVGWTHACALRADGAVFCWGSNGSGELGNGTFNQSLTPVQVPGVVAKQIAAASGATCALLTDGGVACWGSNGAGQLGNGTGQTSAWPVRAAGLTGVTSIAGASTAYHFCAMMSQGISCWGANWYGQLGDGSYANAFEPVPMSSL